MALKEIEFLGDKVVGETVTVKGEQYARVYFMGCAMGAPLLELPACVRDHVEVRSCDSCEVHMAACRLWPLKTGDAGLTSIIDEVMDMFDQCVADGFSNLFTEFDWHVGYPAGAYDLLLPDEEQLLLRLAV